MLHDTTSALCLTCLVIGCHDPGNDEETTQTSEPSTQTDTSTTGPETSTETQTGTETETGTETDTDTTDDGEPLPERVRLAYRLSLDEWQGHPRVQMVVEAAG